MGVVRFMCFATVITFRPANAHGACGFLHIQGTSAKSKSPLRKLGLHVRTSLFARGAYKCQITQGLHRSLAEVIHFRVGLSIFLVGLTWPSFRVFLLRTFFVISRVRPVHVQELLPTSVCYPPGRWTWCRECPAGSNLCTPPTPYRFQKLVASSHDGTERDHISHDRNPTTADSPVHGRPNAVHYFSTSVGRTSMHRWKSTAVTPCLFAKISLCHRSAAVHIATPKPETSQWICTRDPRTCTKFLDTLISATTQAVLNCGNPEKISENDCLQSSDKFMCTKTVIEKKSYGQNPEKNGEKKLCRLPRHEKYDQCTAGQSQDFSRSYN